MSERRISLRFPHDITDGSYSTAYASGIIPQDLIVPLVKNVFLQGPPLNGAYSAIARHTLRNEFDVWGTSPEIVVHRRCAWKISHMPSLQDVNATEYVLISKSETENQKIVAIFYDKVSHMETRRLYIGDNEKLYPTDCVSMVSASESLFYVALNKRTKSSEPHSTEVLAYDLK